MTTHNELMAEATQNYAMAHHYLGKLKVTLDQLSAVQSGIAQASRPPVRCVREWQDWLSDNGPTIKGDIQEATGIKFTERGTPYTVEWTPSLAGEADDRFAPDTLMKINTKADGRGAPPKIYFLWSQRWDVLPKFGVGPVRPENVPEPVVLTGLTFEESQEALYGPTEDDGEITVDPVTVETLQAMFDGGPDGSSGLTFPRFATMAEWDDAWAAEFDGYAAAETKPTDEQKQAMRASVPEGADGNAAIAIAYRAAVERLRNPQPMLGVIQPPVQSPYALTDGPWEEQPLDWDTVEDPT